jgi:hypothetical protein
MISAADPVVPWAAPPAPIGPACGFFDRGEVFGRSRQRGGSTFDLRLSRTADKSRRSGKYNPHPAHRCPPCGRSAPNAESAVADSVVFVHRTQERRADHSSFKRLRSLAPAQRFAPLVVPDIVGSGFPEPYQFQARIQCFQALAAAFPRDSPASPGSLGFLCESVVPQPSPSHGVGPRPPRRYQFQAQNQYFQSLAAPFPAGP